MGNSFSNNSSNNNRQIPWHERLVKSDPTLRVHLLAIGGSGLSAIAKVLLESGIQVSGSDRQDSPVLTELEHAGARVFRSQFASNLTDLPNNQRPDVVLMSSAIDASNPERQAAERLGIPIMKRSEFLPALLSQRQVIAVSGTHGKSTTTAMIITGLRQSGIECGYIVGATLPIYGNAAAGSSPWFVIEADEYDRMFHGLQPTIAIVTNVEWDHPDCYPTAESFHQAFIEFIEGTKANATVITCADDAGAESVGEHAQRNGRRWLRYGLNEPSNGKQQPIVQAIGLRAVAEAGYSASVCLEGKQVGQLVLKVPGLHNVRNSLAAFAALTTAGVQAQVALDALSHYTGSGRRFEVRGEAAGVMVIDDYAHHPTEIKATLSAARNRYPQRRIWAIFQPHTYSRTRTLLQEMAASFADADRVIVSDIYAARERDDGSVKAADLVAASRHPSIRHIGKLTEISETLASNVVAGDVVITLSAGDGNRVGEWLLTKLSEVK
ncbi:MAG: UDP-N-acetylmuramate--L-alanine ligase [Caldilineaceae bacterium]